MPNFRVLTNPEQLPHFTTPLIRRVVIVVADGLGVGGAPDAEKFQSTGANTLGHMAQAVDGVSLPFLQKAGLGNLTHTQLTHV
jgi:phosphopentomutase